MCIYDCMWNPTVRLLINRFLSYLIILQIVPSVGDAVTEEISSSPHITAFFLELVRVASCSGVSLAL